MKYCNCLTFAIKKYFKYGGRIRFSKSKTWFGFHVTYIDPLGKEWEYTLIQPKKHPYWYIPMCYKGIVKRVKNTS